MPLPVKIPFSLMKFFFKTPAEGAKNSIFLASSEDVKNVSGKYFVDCRDATSTLKPYVSDPEKAKMFWEKSLEYVKLEAKDPKI